MVRLEDYSKTVHTYGISYLKNSTIVWPLSVSKSTTGDSFLCIMTKTYLKLYLKLLGNMFIVSCLYQLPHLVFR